jgi:hypothetical protein
MAGVHAFRSTRVSKVHARFPVHVYPGFTFSENTLVRGKHFSLVHVSLGSYNRFSSARVSGNMHFLITRVSVVRFLPHYTCVREYKRFPSTRVCGIGAPRAHVCS